MASPPKPVLVVDDDWDILEAMHDTLAVEGYDTVDVGDGQRALDYLRSHPPPGLVLLDWNMPRMNAQQFMAALARDPLPETPPIVLLTADAKIAEKGAGYAGYLKKPVELDKLFETVRRYCGPGSRERSRYPD
ncbi:MAG: response regulator [Deltaproteobacteria bacterium]|nr:response regulator [Deltaproteobacteria bacterium]